MRAATCVFFALATLLSAQYPGQYPPGGGQYPPGQYPPGGQYPGGGIPMPGRKGKGKSQTTKDHENQIPLQTQGMLRRLTSRHAIITADDHRVVWFRLGDGMKWDKAGTPLDFSTLKPGDHISVDYFADEDGIFTAVAIHFQSAGSPGDRAAAEQGWDLPRQAQLTGVNKAPSGGSGSKRGGGEVEDEGPPKLRRNSGQTEEKAEDAKPEPKKGKESKKEAAEKAESEEQGPDPGPATVAKPKDVALDDDDPGRPMLKRGSPKPRPETKSSSAPVVVAERAPSLPPGGAPAPTPRAPSEPPAAPAAVPAPAAPAEPETVKPKEDELLERARQAAAEYTNSLPNFLCKQSTTRYWSTDPKRGWDALDMVSADLTYEEGHESYKNIAVNNKPTNKSMMDIGGSTSTGEFGSTLRALFATGAADFARAGSDTIEGRSAMMYRFRVPRERSGWRIDAPSQLYYPAFAGTVWIDKETGQTLRIEQQAKGMPRDFPFDTIESTVEYGLVRLLATKESLVPTTAEILSCQRGTSTCTRNRIEFRNYRKFGSESDITFGKQ